MNMILLPPIQSLTSKKANQNQETCPPDFKVKTTHIVQLHCAMPRWKCSKGRFNKQETWEVDVRCSQDGFICFSLPPLLKMQVDYENIAYCSGMREWLHKEGGLHINTKTSRGCLKHLLSCCPSRGDGELRVIILRRQCIHSCRVFFKIKISDLYLNEKGKYFKSWLKFWLYLS